MKVEVVLTDGGQLPNYGTEHAAGADLRSRVDLVLQPGERRLVPTGIRLAIPPGFEAQVRPRSGLALKHGISMVNTPGTIDQDFRGEVGVLLINHGQEDVEIRAGDRIAQLVVCPVVQATFVAVEALEATERGEGGFGSTGTR